MISRRALIGLGLGGLAAAVLLFSPEKRIVEKPQVQITPKFDAFFLVAGKSILKIFTEPAQDEVSVYDGGNLAGRLSIESALYVPLPFGETKDYNFVHTPSGLSVPAKRKFLTRDELSSRAIQELDMGKSSAEFVHEGVRYFVY